MATYTISINERTTTGKAVVEFLRSLGMLGEKKAKKDKEADLTMQAINEIKEGKCTRCNSFEEYLKEIEK
ncbi:MAG: hypothetical protein E7077_00155 [Bacteroidales bacterium]|jgi:hypothetical protein|nr:hypothetical protein [Bacteroidales bacterium]MCR5248358.1 hypothetical protein [Paludibacteraceae bacterium]